MIQVKPGDRVAVTREGVFKTPTGEITVKVGQRGRVLEMASRSHRNKKIWAKVEIFGEKGNVIARINMPGWWLVPRTVLDDLAEV